MSCLWRCCGSRNILVGMSVPVLLQTRMLMSGYAKHNHSKVNQKSTFYKRLQLSPAASADEIKSAYRQLALQWHPDVVENEHRAEAEVKFRGISEAYEILSDPEKRRLYDTSIGITQHEEKTKMKAAEQHEYYRKEPREHKQTSTSWSSSSSSSSSSFASHNKRRKPFVRGDANRTFAKVFEGKTLEQILFEGQRRQRERYKQDRQAHTSFAREGAHSSSTTTKANKESRMNSNSDTSKAAKEEECITSAHASSSNNDEKYNSSHNHDANKTYMTSGYDASMERVLDHAARSFANRAQRQYGPSILKHIKLIRRNNIYAKPPPDTFMPFRPFVNTRVPDGVQTLADPVMGPLEHVNSDKLDSSLINYDISEFDQSDEMRTQNNVNIVIDKFEDGTPETRNETLTKIRKRVHNLAPNVGQLYSYQRPYERGNTK